MKYVKPQLFKINLFPRQTASLACKSGGTLGNWPEEYGLGSDGTCSLGGPDICSDINAS